MDTPAPSRFFGQKIPSTFIYKIKTGIELVNYAAFLTPSFYKKRGHFLLPLLLATLVDFAVNNGYDIYPAS